MGLFNKPAKAGFDDNNNSKSEATTVVASQNVSDSDLDKPAMVAEETTALEKDEESRLALSSSSPPKKMDIEPELSSSVTDVEVKEQDAAAIPGPQGDEATYPSGLKLGLIMLALCLSVFLVALDNTIIATAIPKITDHFKSLNDVGWYGSSYLLTTCALQLFFGK